MLDVVLDELVHAPSAVTSQTERELLVASIKKHAAEPGSVNQGKHNTCALAALETRMYRRNPVAVAELLKDVATRGSCTLASGRTVQIDQASLRPDQEARCAGYGLRSYASQLFQIATANIYWQSQEKDPRGIECGAGKIKYVQRAALAGLPQDTGERLLIDWGDGTLETVVDDGGTPVSQPCLSLSEVQRLARLLENSVEQTFVIAAKRFDRGSKYIAVSSIEDLRRKLIQLKQQQALPLVAAVDSNAGWLAREAQLNRLPGGWYTLDARMDPGKHNLAQPDSKAGWHAICVTDFDVERNAVSVDNFWGPHADHLNDKAISINDFYAAITSNNLN